MSDSPFAELEMAVREALRAKGDAAERYETARHALERAKVTAQLAEFAAQGITPGCKVKATWRDWNGADSGLAIFAGVIPASWGGGKVKADLRKVKKDGGISSQKFHAGDHLTLELAQ